MKPQKVVPKMYIKTWEGGTEHVKREVKCFGTSFIFELPDEFGEMVAIEVNLARVYPGIEVRAISGGGLAVTPEAGNVVVINSIGNRASLVGMIDQYKAEVKKAQRAPKRFRDGNVSRKHRKAKDVPSKS